MLPMILRPAMQVRTRLAVVWLRCRRLCFQRACRDFNFDSTSCLPSFFVAAFVAGEVVPLPSASLRLVPDPFFISTLSAGSSLDPARGGDLLETEAARSQNSNLWLPRELLSVGFNFQI